MLKLVNPAVVREVMKLQRAQLVEEATKVGLEEFPGLTNMLGTYDMICDDVDRILLAMPDASAAAPSDEQVDITKYWQPIRALYKAPHSPQDAPNGPEATPDMAAPAPAVPGAPGAAE